MAPNLITDTSEEGAEDEGEHGAEGLLIGDVERVVVLAVEEARESQCELGGAQRVGRGTDEGRARTELPVWKAH